MRFFNTFVIQKNYCFLYFPQKLSLTLKRLQGSFLSRRCLIFKVRVPRNFAVENYYTKNQTDCQEKLFNFLIFGVVFAVRSDSFDIISQQNRLVNNFFQIFLSFFRKFFQQQYLVVKFNIKHNFLI